METTFESDKLVEIQNKKTTPKKHNIYWNKFRVTQLLYSFDF